jgi:uncharacterized protein (DUF2267 family)
MTMPLSYAHASEDFERFIVDARDRLSLAIRHQVFTVVQAVLWVFRRRLDVSQAIAFAQVLPPVLCAIFLQDWNPAEPAVPFGEREELAREVQSVRGDHNFAPGDAIDTVAATLRRHIDRDAFDAVLASMPGDAAKYWAVRVR